jgi:SAM-dependent methyltransferase
MDLAAYDDFYRHFCDSLPPGHPRVLDAACGPGNVSRYLVARRPDLDLLGIDLSPRMVDLARAAVPSARFLVHDCRRLADLQTRFHGIICAFGLPYLSHEEGANFIRAAADALEPGGLLYLSTMLGGNKDSGLERCSTGDEVYVTYHEEGQFLRLIQDSGFSLVEQEHMPSPNGAVKPTTDLIVIARKT